MTHRVLLCTIGATPQVVTETLWALGRQTPAWKPDEIHVVTTAFKLSHIRQSLQAADCPLAKLLRIDPPPVTIHVPRQDGRTHVVGPKSAQVSLPANLLRDVNSEREAAIMGNLILRLIVGFTRDPQTELHVSLAGGRKTMSAHALMALSLVGRPRDKASHVLVDPDYEDHPEFWHPGQDGMLVRKEDLRKDSKPVPTLDPVKANVVLVLTPAPLMRHRVEEHEELEKLDLLELMARANLAAVLQDSPQVRLDVGTNSVSAGGVTIELGPKLFAVYRLLATARKESWPGVGPDGIGTGHAGWLSFSSIACGTTSSGKLVRERMTKYISDAEAAGGGEPENPDGVAMTWQDDIRTTNDRDRIANITASLNPNVSNLEITLREKLGPDAAAILAPVRDSTTRGQTRFGLTIPSNKIEIV